MPTLKKDAKKSIKVAQRATGASRLDTRKAVASAAKNINGGVSRAGRILRGAGKIGATIVPGAGGALLGGLNEQLATKDSNKISQKALINETPIVNINSDVNPIGSPYFATQELVRPITTPASDKLAPIFQEAEEKTEKPAQTKSIADIAKEDEQKDKPLSNIDPNPSRTGASLLPDAKGNDDKEKKEKQRRIGIIVAIILLLIFVYFISRNK